MFRKATELRRERLWPRLALVGAVTAVTGVGAFAGVSEASTPNAVPAAVVEAQQQPHAWAVVDVAPGVTDATTTTSVDPSTATLPETGSNTGIGLAVGLTALSAGTALVVFARRRRQPSPDA